MYCPTCNLAKRAIYLARMTAALDDLVRRVANGSMPEAIARYVADDHKVSEEDLLARYDERVYVARSHLESFV
jgi:chromosomal replication initiation ATPase DnaA